MKKLAFKPGTLLAAVMFLVSSALTAQEVTKEYNKEYKVTESSSLELDNRYGDIIVESSQTDQVIINVKVTVKYPNQERAQKLLGYINVEFTEEAGNIKAKTTIDDKFSFTGWGGDSRKFTIDYHVKMPATLDLNLYNRYGDTDLDDLSGFIRLDVKYGNLTAGKLLRGNEKPLNELNLAYGKATIDEAGWLDASIRYSGNFTLSKCQALLLDSRYSSINLGTVSSVVGESRYDGKFRIENINNLVLDEGYSTVNVGTLNKKLTLDAGYGSFSADVVPAGFEAIKVDSRYAAIRFGIDESANYNLDAKISYGSLKYNEDNFRNKRRIVENTSTEVSGVVGKEEAPMATVKIDASYALVKLY
ncbi:MAG: hypothetical protein NT092_12050 [Bacteroidia bacterium]|nr:hypothetical protein [Bacteroidia bacterium]